MDAMHLTKFMAGEKWALLVKRAAPSSERPKPTDNASTADTDGNSLIVEMPPPAPLESVPFLSQEESDMHTRVVMLGSLARSNDPIRAFWESAQTIVPDPLISVSTVAAGDLIKGDVIFISRDDNLLSQTIRFWTQSPFNHSAIVAKQNTIVETYPNKGLLSHTVNAYLERLCKDHALIQDKPFALWVVRLAQLNETFDLNMETVAWDDYDSESVLENIIHAGNSDGPDHPIPFPWASPKLCQNEHVRLARPWETRKSYSCADLIARLLDLDPYETYQWLPGTLFAKLITLPGSRVMKIDTSELVARQDACVRDGTIDPACVDSKRTIEA